MIGLLSSISGKFGRSLMLGTVLPVTVCLAVARVVILPRLSLDPTWSIETLEGLETQWELALFLLIAVALSGVLVSLNASHIRLYEGYPWRATWFGRWRTRRHQRRLDVAAAQKAGIKPLLAAGARPSQEDALKRVLADAARRLESEFPKRSSVLPTRLGNVIRAAENYPRRRYGMSAVPLWPRLAGLLDPTYATAIDNEKASFDFTLNSCTLLIALSGLSFVTAFTDPSRLISAASVGWWATETIGFGVLAWVFYRLTIPRAEAWSDRFKGAFDLYRGRLLEHLGYAWDVLDPDTERDLWKNISKRMLFGRPPGDGELLPYSSAALPTVPLVTAPEKCLLKLHRGVHFPLEPGVRQIVVTIVNEGPETASTVRVLEVIETGWKFVWGSARATGTAVSVQGGNPYAFQIVGPLAANRSLELEYALVADPWKTEAYDG